MGAPPAPLPDINPLMAVMKMTAENDSSASSSNNNSSSSARQGLQKVASACDQYYQDVLAARDVLVKAQKLHKELQTTETKDAFQEARQQIFQAAYYHKFCLVSTFCPRQCTLYGGCWKFANKALGDEAMKQMSHQRTLQAVCKPERDVIQRCLGRIVSSAVEEELYDPMNSSSGGFNKGFPPSAGTEMDDDMQILDEDY